VKDQGSILRYVQHSGECEGVEAKMGRCIAGGCCLMFRVKRLLSGGLC